MEKIRVYEENCEDQCKFPRKINGVWKKNYKVQCNSSDK